MCIEHLRIYKMNAFTPFTVKARKKKDFEVVEYCGKIWMNQEHLEEKLDIANITDRTQNHSSKFKKMRSQIQKCGKYEPCRMVIENTLAVEITIIAVKIQAAIF